MIMLLFALISTINATEIKIGFIPGVGQWAGNEDVAFERAGIKYETIGENDYTLSNLSKYNVIGVDALAYDSNPDLKTNYQVVKQYIQNGGYLVFLDYQQDSTWKAEYLPYSLTLFDDDIVNSQEATLTDHPLFDFPNEITAETHFAANLWGANRYFADGAHEASSPWKVLVKDVASGWAMVVGADYGSGYVIFSGLRTLESVSDADTQEVVEFLQNLLLWKFYSDNPGLARSPYPVNGQTDVFNNQILSWKPGTDVKTHYVFISTDFNDVKEATIDNHGNAFMSEALDANSFDHGLLELEKTHYWRVDAVSASSEVTQGMIWSFTVEDAALNLLPDNIIKVTAISSLEGSDPNDLINESGLDPNKVKHSTGEGHWASSGLDTNDVWVQFEFDKIYKIHKMLVWNYNRAVWNNYYGFKEVLIQYTEDVNSGVWKDIPDVNKFEKASGKESYECNNIIDMNDVAAKAVRITVYSNWSTSATYKDKSRGLSEVRFTYIPVWPRNFTPADEATVDFDAILKWRKGREALTHNLYFDTNEVNVTERIVTPISLKESVYAPVLRLGKTYYWRVDELNPDMTPSVWASDVLSFSTPANILIDGFESNYGNDPETNAIFLTWKDGAELGDGANGSYMGRRSTPYLHTINHSGGHSAPMEYENKSYSYSEVIADTSELLNGSDWSIGLPSTLTIWFRGDPNTTEVGDQQLYCKIGGKTITYSGSLDILMTNMWRQFDINLDTLGVDLSNIPTITIGIKKVSGQGGNGVIYLDDIQLTGNEPVIAYPEILIEAEDYDDILAPMEVNNVITGASGGEYIHVKNGTESSTANPPTVGIVTYEVDLDGGQYVISGRVIIGNENQDSFWVKVDEATPNQVLHESGWCMWNNIPTGANWHWDDIHNASVSNNPVVIWKIPAGKATIRIAYRESDAANPPKLDALMIQKVGN